MTRADEVLQSCQRCKGPMDDSEFMIESFEVSGGQVLCESCTDEMYEAEADQ